MLTFHAKDIIIIIIFNVVVILLAQMPAKYRKNKVKPRGVSNRNRGLQWIRANATEGNRFNVKTLSTPTNCDKFYFIYFIFFSLKASFILPTMTTLMTWIYSMR